MSVRHRVGVRVVLMAAAASVAAIGPARGAPSSLRWGWWTAATPVIYPDVPPDGLVVHGGSSPDAPLAYSAVGFEVDPQVTSVSLRLSVAPGSASTPGASVAACPLTGASFSPARGGPLSDAPPFDCTTRVTAGPSADGSTYRLDLTSLVREGGVAVAVVPTAAGERVVFSAPTPSAVEVAEPPTGAGAVAGPVGPAEPGAVAPSGGDGDAGASAVAITGGADSLVLPPPPAVPEAAAPAPPEVPRAVGAPGSGGTGTTVAGAGEVAQAPTVAAATERTSGVAAAAFAGLAVFAALLWFLAGRGPDEIPTDEATVDAAGVVGR